MLRGAILHNNPMRVTSTRRVRWQSTSQDGNFLSPLVAQLLRGHSPRVRSRPPRRWSGLLMAFRPMPHALCGRVPQRPQRSRLRRRSKRDGRVPLGGGTIQSPTGGVAWTQIKASASFTSLPTFFNWASPQVSSNKTGAVAGGGFEYRFTSNVSFVGELLWYGFGTTSVSAFCHCENFPLTYTTAFKSQDIVAGTLGVNWRF